MYKDFLQRETKTFEGRHRAEEYIFIVDKRLKDINLKLKGIEQESLNNPL